MDGFQNYINSLPEQLDKAEQDMLVYEYVKTKNEDIREKLIYHNLIFCAKVANKFCAKNNIMDKVEDINSICVVALVKAIDEYSLEKGASFSTHIYNYMNFGIKSDYQNFYKDVMIDAVHISQMAEDGEDLDEDRLNFLYDSDESHIAEDFGEKCFVRDLMGFIDTWDNDLQLVYKMYCGIGGFEKTSQRKITQTTGIYPGRVRKYIYEGEKLVRDYIVTYYSSSFPQIKRITTGGYFEELYERLKEKQDTPSEEISSVETKKKKTIQDLEYEYNSYYGLNGCEKKTQMQLAKELRISYSTVGMHVKRYKEYLESLQGTPESEK